ncbi:MAG TPA: hypothetical protein VNG93_13615 [Candidatus Dormibacteraeota bacterium]|nr:hypothetical protein [Candidatus Dormibacteraeota bacterium]
MRFENLFSRSARLLWLRPWLWLLALLAGESSGAGGGGGGGSIPTGATTSPGGKGAGIAPPDLAWVPGWINDRIALLLTIAVVVLVVSLLLFLLSCLASGALVGSVARLDAGEPVSLRESMRVGARSFWRVLGFRLVLLLLVLLPLLLLLIPPLAGAAFGGVAGLIRGLLLDLPLLVALLFWLFLVGILALLGLRACVLDGAGPIASFRVAQALLRRRFSRIALTWVIVLATGVGIGIVFQVVLGIVSAPFVGPIVEDVTTGRWGAALGTSLFAGVILVPVSVALSSAGGAYFATLWTVAYRRFDQEGQVPEPPPLAS